MHGPPTGGGSDLSAPPAPRGPWNGSHTMPSTVRTLFFAAVAGLAPVSGVSAQTFDWPAPTFDRWNYPFNTTPGTKTEAQVFANFQPEFIGVFDERDGQLLVTFLTDDLIAPGQGPGAYDLASVTLTATVARDATFFYDPTPDPWQTRLPATDPAFIPDTDAGDAIVLSGTDFRNGFTALTYADNGAYSLVGAFGTDIRNAFAASFDAGGSLIDISNNVRDGFDPTLFGVGLADAVAPGAIVPINTMLMFEVDLSDAFINAYVREGLDAGVLSFTISTKTPTVQQSPAVPVFYTDESATGPAVTLSITLGDGSCSPADVTTDGSANGVPDGLITLSDFSFYLSRWSAGDASADITLDGVCDPGAGGGDGVSLSDFSCFLSLWSDGCP